MMQKTNTLLKFLKDNSKEEELSQLIATDLIWGFGAIHCLTQQEPR